MDKIAKDQAADMAKSIAEAARAATAIEGFAKSAADSAKAAKDALDIAGRQQATLDKQSEILEASDRHFQAVERASISISHRDCYLSFGPDGQGGQDEAEPMALALTVVMNNSGKTPGDMIGGYFGFVIAQSPRTPDLLSAIRITPAFLLTDSPVDFDFTITVASRPDLHDAVLGVGDNRLWLIGEVDYRDRFGAIHRGGYARLFSRGNRRRIPSFVFSPETAALNYDRPLTDEEKRHYTG